METGLRPELVMNSTMVSSSEDTPLQPIIDPGEVMKRVRQEFARRYPAGAHAFESADAAFVLPRWRPSAPRLRDKAQYSLSDFLCFDDEDFIDVAYRKLLRRPANDEGSRKYLEALRSGLVSKVEILGLIRSSEEGRMNSVQVNGLLLPYKLHRWRHVRIIGWFIGLAVAVARMPRLVWRLQGIEASAARETQALGQLLNRVEAAVERSFLDSETAVQSRLTRIEAAQEQWRRGAQQRHDELAEKLMAHEVMLAKLSDQTRSDQRSLRAMLERLTVFLDLALRREKSGQQPQSDEPSPTLEAQYSSFEDAFRGQREQIKQRVARYLGTLAAAGVEPSQENLILDLGSGRGEWLEVLAEHGYRGRGVDLNRGMLRESEARGHEVVEADVLDYLRTLDGDSVAAITSMHLVEHLPHPVLLQLFDEMLRVLRPGGVLILETPNPENVLVGSCMFYMDPTHLHPIPPLLLQWSVQARGFELVTIERLSEHRGQPDLLPVSENVPGAPQINQMIKWFTAAPDYAVIARKPASS